jgi:excisionase family DNA binding protein
MTRDDPHLKAIPVIERAASRGFETANLLRWQMENPKTNDREHQIGFEPLVDSRTAAAAFGIHYKTLERMAREGLVPAAKVGRSWQFRMSVLSDWFNGK